MSRENQGTSVPKVFSAIAPSYGAWQGDLLTTGVFRYLLFCAKELLMTTRTHSTAEHFAHLPRTITFDPKKSGDLNFRWWNPKRMVEGKTMAAQLPIAMAYWHSIVNPLGDPFGPGTAQRPWDKEGLDPLDRAKYRADALGEMLSRLGITYYCFHCADICPPGNNLAAFHRNLDVMVRVLEQLQKDRCIKLGWGTANLFSDPKFMHGSLNANDPLVFAHSVACVKKMLEVTQALGGENYVFWGGRNGYDSLWNTDMGHEFATMAKFYELMLAYADKINFKGTFLIEPKAREPKSFQYDFSAAETLAFLLRYGFEKRFKLNIETDHANLAGRTMFHELTVAGLANALGGVDVNQFTPNVLWDTDAYLSDRKLATEMMFAVLHAGGLGTGVFNFDAKPRRESFTLDDLFHGHVLGMETLAFGLLTAAEIRRRGDLKQLVQNRYAGWSGELGQQILGGKLSFEEIAHHAYRQEPLNISGGFERTQRIVQEAMDAVVADA